MGPTQRSLEMELLADPESMRTVTGIEISEAVRLTIVVSGVVLVISCEERALVPSTAKVRNLRALSLIELFSLA